jgi:hypothetical protein
LKYTLACALVLFALHLQAHIYSTDFPAAENPISETGRWLNGKLDGQLWKDVQTTEHFAVGTPETEKYDDPTAILKGTWASDQLAQATVRVTSEDLKTCCHEVELRLRMTVAPGKITGYEILCSVVPAHPYAEIVRWNGPLSSFDYVARQQRNYCQTGDVLEADIIGSTITARLNHKVIVTGTDHTFASGNPGIGFYQSSPPIDTYGFSDFMAIDSQDAGWKQVMSQQGAGQ